MSIAGVSVGGWQLPAAGKAGMITSDHFSLELDDDLLLATVGSTYDTDLSAGVRSFFDGSPWHEGGQYGGEELPAGHGGPGALVLSDPLSTGVLARPAPGTGRDSITGHGGEWRCLLGCAQPCGRCVP